MCDNQVSDTRMLASRLLRYLCDESCFLLNHMEGQESVRCLPREEFA